MLSIKSLKRAIPTVLCRVPQLAAQKGELHRSVEIAVLTLYQGMPFFFLLWCILLVKNNSSIPHDAF